MMRYCLALLAILALSTATPQSESPPTCSSAACLDDATSFIGLKVKSELRSIMMEEQRVSSELAKTLTASVRDMPESTTRELFQSFMICGQCSSFVRFGEAHDGGYLMCNDGLQKANTLAAYSLGVEHHDQWSQDVVNKLGVSVNQFDCTVDGSDCQGCRFYKKCIVSADGQHPVPGHVSDGWSLQQALSETGQHDAPEGSLLMKMDIESSEWPLYSSEPPDALKKFGQLIVEFHNLQDMSKHDMYLKAMQHIAAAGFKVAHLHGNNYEGMFQLGSLSVPRVVEVTFVHGAARPNGCSADQLYESLDAPNNPTNVELPMGHLN